MQLKPRKSGCMVMRARKDEAQHATNTYGSRNLRKRKRKSTHLKQPAAHLGCMAAVLVSANGWRQSLRASAPAARAHTGLPCMRSGQYCTPAPTSRP